MEDLKPVQRAILNGNGQHGNDEAARVSPSAGPWRLLKRFWESRGLPSKLIALTAVFVLVAGIYFAMSYPLSLLVRAMERRLRIAT